MPLQAGLFPYLMLFLIYKTIASMSKYCSSAEMEFDEVHVRGRSFDIGKGSLKAWHVYVIGQIMDSLSDVLVCRAFLQDQAVDTATKVLWSFTTFISIFVPALYFTSYITYALCSVISAHAR